MNNSDKRPLVGISTCLLGENVRYDGGHQLDRFLRDILGQHVDYYPLCPEVACGLPIPREAMHLAEQDGVIRLITGKTGIDITPRMRKWMQPVLKKLTRLPLCGFIFKSRSPSSGLHRVKVYYANGGVSPSGRGIFAQGVTDIMPLLPVEDDGRLHDAGLRENFIERIFAMHRWHQLQANRKSRGQLIDFHARHKYQIMAHDPQGLRALGRITAHLKGRPLSEAYAEYLELFLAALQRKATVKKNVNVMQHIMGYFKKQLSTDAKQELLECIEQYQQHLVPQIVPLTLLNHYIRKYQPKYLLNQYYLKPHPQELMLRNHV